MFNSGSRARTPHRAYGGAFRCFCYLFGDDFYLAILLWLLLLLLLRPLFWQNEVYQEQAQGHGPD